MPRTAGRCGSGSRCPCRPRFPPDAESASQRPSLADRERAWAGRRRCRRRRGARRARGRRTRRDRRDRSPGAHREDPGRVPFGGSRVDPRALERQEPHARPARARVLGSPRRLHEVAQRRPVDGVGDRGHARRRRGHVRLLEARPRLGHRRAHRARARLGDRLPGQALRTPRRGDRPLDGRSRGAVRAGPDRRRDPGRERHGPRGHDRDAEHGFAAALADRRRGERVRARQAARRRAQHLRRPEADPPEPRRLRPARRAGDAGGAGPDARVRRSSRRSRRGTRASWCTR